MKKTVHLLAGLALVAVVAGCTSNSTDPDTAGAESTQNEVQPNQDTSINPLATQAEQDPNQEPVPEDTAFLEELGVNDRGNVEVATEEPAVFEVPDSDTVFAEFVAENVSTNFQCTAEGALDPVNGQFVALDFQITADENLPESGFPYFYLSVHEFRAWDAQGERITDPVGNAESCITAEERVPSPIDPGENVSGLIILDVPEGSGSASFSMGGFQGSYGWEWNW